MLKSSQKSSAPSPARYGINDAEFRIDNSKQISDYVTGFNFY